MRTRVSTTHRIDNASAFGFYETAINPENGIYVLTVHEFADEDGATTHVDVQVTQENAVRLLRKIIAQLKETAVSEGLAVKHSADIGLEAAQLDAACQEISQRSD